MDTINVLNHMLKDIKKHRRNKDKLLEYYIQKRLNMSLKNYYKELLETYDFLTHKNAKKVVRAMTKLDKEGN